MSSFFTTPKKRKNSAPDTAKSSKRSKAPREATKKAPRKQPTVEQDEDISSEEENEKNATVEDEEVEDEDEKNETAAERRLRLAQQYLENIQEDIDADEAVGFNAEDVDREIIASRLKEGVAEKKGKVYRFLAATYDYSKAVSTKFRMDTKSFAAVAVSLPYIYTVTKDRYIIKWKVDGWKKPKRVAFVRGSRKYDVDHDGHIDDILTVAASSDGKFVVTGGRDNRMIVWDAETLKPLRVFKQHRAAVTGLAFRRNTNQLYSCSADRTCKVWSLDELAYIETLFGHQDEILGIAALAQERCVTVGSRDRTARLWKVVDETQLVFRGGGEGKRGNGFSEGSMDCVSMVDDDHFITGSDNGAISFWSAHKKKAITTIGAAHGIFVPLAQGQQTAEQQSTDVPLPPARPREITALAALPYSDIFFSGSYDGYIRAWQISEDKRKVLPLGRVGVPIVDSTEAMDLDTTTSNSQEDSQRNVKGVINGLAVFEAPDSDEDLAVVAAVGREFRLGRWMQVEGQNTVVMFRIRKASMYAPDPEAE